MSPDILLMPQLSKDYPYMVTRIVGGMYHVTPLPADRSEQELLTLTERQIVANKLHTCLALAPDRGIFFEPRTNKTSAEATGVPRGGILEAGKLRPVPEVHNNKIIQERILQLQIGIRQDLQEQAALAPPGKVRAQFMMGDLTKGNRLAMARDIRRLKGHHNGIPMGLELCDECQEYRGECLDSGENFTGTIATVHCLCENDNLCAFCEETLAKSRLNANTFNKKDGRIWHLPGFVAFSHKCEETAKQ